MNTLSTNRRPHASVSQFLGLASVLWLTLTALPASADVIVPKPKPTSSQPSPPPAAPGKPASRLGADDLTASGRTEVWTALGMLTLGALVLGTAMRSSRRRPRLAA